MVTKETAANETSGWPVRQAAVVANAFQDASCKLQLSIPQHHLGNHGAR